MMARSNERHSSHKRKEVSPSVGNHMSYMYIKYTKRLQELEKEQYERN